MSRLLRRTLMGVVPLVVGLALCSAWATTALHVTDLEQAGLSTAVVVVTVGAAEVAKHDRYETIVTRTTLRVEEVLYGSAPVELELQQIGGTIGEKTVHIPGDAVFKRGERCVLFLRQHDGRWYLTAMEQSKYRLVEDPRFGLLMERKLGDGIVTRDEQGSLVGYVEPIQRPIKRLESFRAQLARLSAGAEGQK